MQSIENVLIAQRGPFYIKNFLITFNKRKSDTITIISAFPPFPDEARLKGVAVLVHCLAGVSRSVTVTLAYLMHTKSLCLNDAFSLVRARKPDVSPNFHFMEQLHSFERHLKSTRTPSSSTSSAISSPLMDTAGLATTTRLLTEKASCLRPSKYSCACIEVECKCMQGVSPDSGIEFDRSDSLDRWTPAEGK